MQKQFFGKLGYPKGKAPRSIITQRWYQSLQKAVADPSNASQRHFTQRLNSSM